MNQSNYSQTARYRCLNEHYPRFSDDLYLLLCGVETCTPNKEKIARSREGYHLHVILSGEGIVEKGDVVQVLHTGQLFLLQPSEPICYYPVADNPWTYCWISFDGRLAESCARAAGFDRGICWRDSRIEPTRFYRLCDQLLNTPQLTSAGALKRLGLAMEFISLGIESWQLTNQSERQEDHEPLYRKGDYVSHAVEYIQKNYSNINVSDLSRYLGIDRSYLSAIFKQSQGVSPGEYILRVRMRQSCRMLGSLDLSIQDIARYVGYEDSLTFSKAFKRFFGVSPKYFRNLPDHERPDVEFVIQKRDQNVNQES